MWRRMGVVIGLAVVMLVSATIVASPEGDAAAKYKYVSRTKAMTPEQSTLTLKAPCPADRHAIGGGGTVTGGVHESNLMSNAPFDGSDADRKPDDGWKVSAAGDLGSEETVQAWAVCAKGSYKYRKSAPVEVPASDRLSAIAKCGPDEHIVSGGGSVIGNDPDLELTTSAPNDGDDEDADKDDAWAAGFNNPGTAENIQAIAVCAKTPSTIFTASPSFTADTQWISALACGNVLFPTGGGATATPADMDFEIQSTFPVDGAPTVIRPDTWYIQGSTALATTVTIYSICRE